MDTFKKHLQLFWAFLKIGLFTFGGGYAMISVIFGEIVEKRKYITAEEFSDVVSIAESTPGPIAINSATYIGYRRLGILGAITASVAVALPSLFIIFAISLFFDRFMEIELVGKAFKGIQCAVAILIITASFKLYKTVKKNALSVSLIIISAAAMLAIDAFSLPVSSIFIIISGAAAGAITFFANKKVKSVKKADGIDINKSEESEENGDEGGSER